MKEKKANWIGHILYRKCFLKHAIEGKIEGWIEVTDRRGRRHRQGLYVIKERRGYYKLKEETLDGTLWRTRFGRGNVPDVRQIIK